MVRGDNVAKLKITLVRSLIGKPENQRVTVRTLGLRKLNSSVVQEDNPQIRGMVNKVSHLLRVEEV
ncbi:MAG: 50S ribosomal protein L30 [Peptococcaceae bacterium BRH_c4b]|nr:MAG: 50S ribosomal protein L30 [Peptococcaceae bacterium BRH_c4b]